MASKQAKQRQRRPAAAPATQGEAAAGPRFEVRTPHAGFNGERVGLRFRDGVARTDSEAVADECERMGYEVTDLSPEPPPPPAT